MTEEKFKDIVYNMIEIGVLDPAEALIDRNYFSKQFWSYVDAENTVRKLLNQEPIL